MINKLGNVEVFGIVKGDVISTGGERFVDFKAIVKGQRMI